MVRTFWEVNIKVKTSRIQLWLDSLHFFSCSPVWKYEISPGFFLSWRAHAKLANEKTDFVYFSSFDWWSLRLFWLLFFARCCCNKNMHTQIWHSNQNCITHQFRKKKYQQQQQETVWHLQALNDKLEPW